MDAQQMISEFLSSPQGAQAAQSLAGQGFNPDDVQQMLSHVAETTHSHAEEQNAGVMGDHPGKSFFAAFAAGLVKGDGFFGSLFAGGEGILTGRVAESLAGKMGIDPGAASTVAAAATPYVVAFLKEKFA